MIPILLAGHDRRDSGYETRQLGVTFGDIGLPHTARGGKERRQTSAWLMLLLREILSWGKNLQILQLAEPCRHPAREWLTRRQLPSPVLPGHSCAGGSAGARGNPPHGGLLPSPLCSWSLQLPSGNTFPPASVPRNSLLTPCFCTTLHSPPSRQIPPCGPQRTAQLPLHLFVFTACLWAFQRALHP